MPRRSLFWLLTAAAVVVAVLQAWQLRWTCDDAYISFRYAWHLVQGHGLVFNLDPQEAPVEGYTNFSWTMLLALGMALGCTGDRIEDWSQMLGILAHGATVLLLARIAWLAGGRRAVVPVAAIGYALLHHGASLAPAGLETAMFVLLGVVMVHLTVTLRCVRQVTLLGFVGVLTAMTRPDGALWCAISGAFVLLAAWERRAPRLLAAYLLPFVVGFLPYLAWRWWYYGYPVPNTFFAKSAADPYPSQGFVYLFEYGRCYLGLLAAALALAVVLPRRSEPLAPIVPWLARRAAMVLAAFVVPYVAFVVWVGGDFMFARFLLPVTPLLLLAVDLAVARLRPVFAWPLALATVLGIAVRFEPPWLGDYTNPHGFSDNRAISVKEFAPGIPTTEAVRLAGHYLRSVFAGLNVRLGIAGSHASLAYRSEVPVAVECAAGLTDAYIAHLPIAARGQVGHEKTYLGYRDYLVATRRLHFHAELSFHTGELTDAWRDVVFPVIPLRAVIWDRALMAELARRDPNIAFTDVEGEIDRYLAAMPGKPRDQVERDFAALRRFYFDHNDDPARLQRFVDWLK